MANSFTKYSDNELQAKVAGMTRAMIQDPEKYGLTLDQVEALQDANEAFDLGIAAAEIANQEKLSAYQTKFAQREDVLTILGSLTQRVYGDRNVTNGELAEAGFSPRPSTRQYNTPNTPTALNVMLTGPATLTLRWKRNGNSTTTSFIIERKIGGKWRQIGSVTASKFLMTDVVVGQKALFRIYAQRGNRRSDYSNQAVIWGTSPSGELELKHAA